MTRNIVLSKFRSNGTLWISPYSVSRAWPLIQRKEKNVLKQAQELFCLRVLVMSSNPISVQERAKTPFCFEESLGKVTFCHLEGTGNLILVDTSSNKLIPADSGFTLCRRPAGSCAGAQQKGGAGICTDTLHITGGLFKKPNWQSPIN